MHPMLSARCLRDARAGRTKEHIFGICGLEYLFFLGPGDRKCFQPIPATNGLASSHPRRFSRECLVHDPGELLWRPVPCADHENVSGEHSCVHLQQHAVNAHHAMACRTKKHYLAWKRFLQLPASMLMSNHVARLQAGRRNMSADTLMCFGGRKFEFCKFLVSALCTWCHALMLE